MEIDIEHTSYDPLFQVFVCLVGPLMMRLSLEAAHHLMC